MFNPSNRFFTVKLILQFWIQWLKTNCFCASGMIFPSVIDQNIIRFSKNSNLSRHRTKNKNGTLMLDTLYDRYQIKVANESTTYLPLVFAVGRQKSTAPTSTAVVSNRPDHGRLFDRKRPWITNTSNSKKVLCKVPNICTTNFQILNSILARILCNFPYLSLIRSNFTKKWNWCMCAF